MAQRVEDHVGESCRRFELVEIFLNHPLINRASVVLGDHQIEILVLIPQELDDFSLRLLPLPKNIFIHRGEVGCRSIPIGFALVDDCEHGVAAGAMQGIQMNGGMFTAERGILVVVQGLEHGGGTAAAHVMTIDRNVLAGCFVVSTPQREQTADDAFLAGEGVIQV